MEKRVCRLDESHCIADWLVILVCAHVCDSYFIILCMPILRGKDFRTSFSRIGGLQALTRAPIISLTASAPPAIEEQLLESLSMHSPTFIKYTLDRPNIFYRVLNYFQGIDIPDISVVVIYRVPNTISQFYQVQSKLIAIQSCIHLLMLQLSGRAGRNNDQSLCILYCRK